MNQYGLIPQMPVNMFAQRAEENARQLARINFQPLNGVVGGAEMLRAMAAERSSFPLGWDERDAKI